MCTLCNRPAPQVGNTAGHGRTPEEPFLTLEYAMSQTTADRGDVIYLMPGHVELVATAGALAMDVAGVTVIGCGNGTIQPIIRFTLAAADMNVTAANITMENINFQAGVADVLIAIHIHRRRLHHPQEPVHRAGGRPECDRVDHR